MRRRMCWAEDGTSRRRFPSAAPADHLKRALCANPRDAEILTAMGESYDRERRPLPAFDCFEKALALDPDNARFVWNLMEQSYLLARDETVLSLDAAFRWETCADRARYFWCGVLCAYSAARLGETEKVRQMADRVLESETSELPQPTLPPRACWTCFFWPDGLTN